MFFKIEDWDQNFLEVSNSYVIKSNLLIPDICEYQ